jgi:hypothetical protein
MITDDLDAAARVLRSSGRALGHLRTSNPIESTFITVGPELGKVAKGADSRAAGMAMAMAFI